MSIQWRSLAHSLLSANVQFGRQSTDNNLMRCGLSACGFACICPALAALAIGALCRAAPPESEGSATHAQLPSLQQVIRRFDFEEPDAAPNSLPVGFYRYIAPSQGFPPFGSMRLTTSVAYSGTSSFEFELGGGSLSARIPTAVIPILPLADYVITSKVRTEGLNNARARLVAWLHDQAGQPIHDSRVQSRLADTHGKWETFSVEIRGDFPQAADLVIELQLVQPGQFESSSIDPDRPLPQDITGHAWFDDVTIAHLPRMNLSMRQPGNIVRQPATPELQVLVSEMTTEQLTARLRVFDLDSRTLFDSAFPAPRGRQAGTIHIPISKCGWYRAVLDVTGHGELARRQWLDFVLLPPKAAGNVEAGPFGVVLPDMSATGLQDAADMVEALHVSEAVVPLWDRDSGQQRGHERQAARRQLIEQLLRQNLGLIFSLDVVPDQLARLASLEPNQILELVVKDPALWRPYLDDVLISFGLEVNRWRIGPPQSTEAFWKPEVESSIANATRSLNDSVPNAHVYAACSIEQGPNDGKQLEAFAIDVPNEIQADAIDEYARGWLASGSALYTNLELLPEDSYAPRQRVADLMIRALHGWRSGLPLLTIPAPWHERRERGASLMPEPAFAAWRTLAQHLSGRTFASELPLTPNLHCWILRGQSRDDAVLVAWSDDAAPQEAPLLTTQLAAGPVRVCDAFGNESTVEPSEGMHMVPLSDVPVFITNVNLELLQFRSGFRIDPDFVPAISKVHEHHLVLQNPWDVPVSGTIRLSVDDEWKLSPSVHEFVLHPHSEVRLPLSIIPQRSILAGRKRINAEVSLNADHAYAMNLHTDLEVGLRNIDLAATWNIVKNPKTGQDDLLITEAVTNKGDESINVDVYLQATGLGQTRRTIAGLGAGDTAVRLFRIPGGALLLAGQPVRVSVAERDGVTRLNHVLVIGSRDQQNMTAAVGQP